MNLGICRNISFLIWRASVKTKRQAVLLPYYLGSKVSLLSLFSIERKKEVSRFASVSHRCWPKYYWKEQMRDKEECWWAGLALLSNVAMIALFSLEMSWISLWVSKITFRSYSSLDFTLCSKSSYFQVILVWNNFECVLCLLSFRTILWLLFLNSTSPQNYMDLDLWDVQALHIKY